MVISGGTCDCDLVRSLIIERAIDTVIAVDGGLKVVDQLEIIPNYIVGDFDTIETHMIERYREMKNSSGNGTPIILEYRPEKDDTDTEIAIQLCKKLQPDSVALVGVTGTRLDHTFANFHMLKQLLDSNIDAAIYDQHNKIYLKHQSFQVKKRNLYGPYFSLLPFTETVPGLTLRGFRYNLENYDLTAGTSLCISNEVVHDVADVEFRDGSLLVFESVD